MLPSRMETNNNNNLIFKLDYFGPFIKLELAAELNPVDLPPLCMLYDESLLSIKKPKF